jgi:hypothetical protein
MAKGKIFVDIINDQQQYQKTCYSIAILNKGASIISINNIQLATNQSVNYSSGNLTDILEIDVYITTTTNEPMNVLITGIN